MFIGECGLFTVLFMLLCLLGSFIADQNYCRMRVWTRCKNEWVVHAAGRGRRADLAATLGQTEQAGGGREGGQVSKPSSSVKNPQTPRGTSQCEDPGCTHSRPSQIPQAKHGHWFTRTTGAQRRAGLDVGMRGRKAEVFLFLHRLNKLIGNHPF